MRIELLKRYLDSPEFEQKLNTRLERLQNAESSPVERVSLILNCKEDPLFFMDTFGMVYEPRLTEQSDLPYFPFDYQRDVVRRVMKAEELGEDLLIDKTRDMGITWTLIWYALWRWLYRDNWYCLLGSRKEDEVDDRTPSSLYGKLRYALYSLPAWVRPQNFRKSEHDLHMKLINPDNRSYIDGESANPNFGRGKRTSMAIMDELYFWKFARESWRSMADSSPCRIAVSTATPSTFARGLQKSMEENGRLISLTWDKHPFKDQKWYEEEGKRRSSDQHGIASELDISYAADPTLAYYPEAGKCRTIHMEYNPILPLYVGLDFGVQDKTSIVYFQRDTANFFVLDGIERRNKSLAWYFPFLIKGYTFEDKDEYVFTNRFTKTAQTILKRQYNQTELDLIKEFNRWGQVVMYCGEVAHKMRMMHSNTSIFQELSAFGIYLRVNDMAIQHLPRRTATKKLLSTLVFNDSTGATEVLDALSNAQYPRTRDSSALGKSMDGPVHDETADIRSAVENFAVNVFGIQGGIREFPYKKIRKG